MREGQNLLAKNSRKEITRDASTVIWEAESQLQIFLGKKQLGMHQTVIKREEKLCSFIHCFF